MEFAIPVPVDRLIAADRPDLLGEMLMLLAFGIDGEGYRAGEALPCWNLEGDDERRPIQVALLGDGIFEDDHPTPIIYRHESLPITLSTVNNGEAAYAFQLSGTTLVGDGTPHRWEFTTLEDPRNDPEYDLLGEAR